MKKLISLILAFALVFSAIPTAFALDATDYASATAVEIGTKVQTSNTPFTDKWFKFTATEDQYYKVTILNQSVELRTNIYFDNLLDSTLLSAFFYGRLLVAIRDSHGLELASGGVRCGYEGSVSLLLEKGKTYYIGFNSNYSGNFRFSIEQLNDMGGNTREEATEITATAQVISRVDAKNDEDWFTFTTDSYHSFYHFTVENIDCTAGIDFKLYEYIEGGIYREIKTKYISRKSTATLNTELKDNTKYYYLITSSSGEGGYLVDVEQIYDAVSSQKSSSYEIECDVKVTSSFDGNGDIDFYRFTTASEDAYYHINYNPLTSSYYYVTLYDAAGTALINQSRNGSTAFSGNIKLQKNTEYYLSLKGDVKGNYEFSVDTVFDPVPDVKEEAVALETDVKTAATYAGNGDTDFYKFTTASEDAYYHISYKPLTSSYYYVKLYDGIGTALINQSRSGTTAFSGNIKLQKNTEYYLSLKGDVKGNYEFSVDTVFDPEPEEKENAVSISVNKEYKRMYAGDKDADYYCFTSPDEDAFIKINYTSVDSNYCKIKLYDASGEELLSASRNGTSPFSQGIRAEKNSEYFLLLEGDYKGEYKFTVEVVEDSAGETMSTAQEISLNTEIKSDLAGNSDIDWYKFTVSDFESCRIRLITESGSAKYLKLYTQREMQLLSFNGTTNKTIELEEGTYYVKISDNEGYYTLVVGTCGNGHDWVLKREIKPATCNEKGRASYYCRCCFEAKTEDVPKLSEHKYEWITEREPSADRDGLMVQKCSVCGAKGDSKDIKRQLLGDVNSDGKITASDARFVLRASVSLETCDKGTDLFAIADADKNGKITAGDARLVLRASVGLEKLN